ncbi:hypothetical protein Q4506_17190 [Colwellia sp. 4_MG-2023]|uniref:hypothetical protein n=1 Tax=unclassified Colwellia TaxID=196834 RepID=UPI0026E44EFE|nr:MULTISPECIES: hypothetical protein [unclassified Colwellia]MDO6508747.1 hypothetical protein [Colwellia sp. 5_MG-2023]MDO6557412.1 hypothetical protein [Colwellia sp. 4_MG-2023]
MEGFIGIILVLVIGLFWLIPLVMLLKSKRTSGGTKALWVLAYVFVAWFAWLAYILLVPKKQPTNNFANTQ